MLMVVARGGFIEMKKRSSLPKRHMHSIYFTPVRINVKVTRTEVTYLVRLPTGDSRPVHTVWHCSQ